MLKSYKLENIHEMGKFLNAFDQPKLNQEDINHLKRFITSNEIEPVMVYQQRKSQNMVDSLRILPYL
jgi:hypothetical protein